MTQGAPDPHVDPVRAAIDSTFMLVLARFFLPGVIGLLGYLLTGVLTDLKQANQNIQVELVHLTAQQSNSQTLAAGISAKLDATAKQLDRVQGQVDALGRRN